ncbi:hypothetical protein BDP27DRAFT_524963 [Rhodocollybia butyracea]|uniref:Uncharacterized protein n=1 Tax=Rhodocollybia butyracea TaxID=206335 RepID=A0A9P5PXX5_9AGAR|nr:hypothetical protein BDP27DRAFT_524963 [Rhodocollybia butyracea]
MERFQRRLLLDRRCRRCLGKTHCQSVNNTTFTNCIPAVIASTSKLPFIAFYVLSSASTQGPGAWAIITSPHPISRRRTGCGSLLILIIPFVVAADKDNLHRECLVGGVYCLIYAYFLIPETKGPR